MIKRDLAQVPLFAAAGGDLRPLRSLPASPAVQDADADGHLRVLEEDVLLGVEDEGRRLLRRELSRL